MGQSQEDVWDEACFGLDFKNAGADVVGPFCWRWDGVSADGCCHFVSPLSGVVSRRGWCFFVWFFLRLHPRCVVFFHALPLCGAAPPFLCCCKEKGGKES